MKDFYWILLNFLEPAVSTTSKFHAIRSHVFRILDFVDGAMETWRLLGSDPSEAKGIVQVFASVPSDLTLRCFTELPPNPSNPNE